MTYSAADLADRSRSDSAGSSATRMTIGRISALTGVLLCLVVQAVNRDFFPPDISVSQYGIGRYGWVFTIWTAVVTVAVLTLLNGDRIREHGAVYWASLGSVGLLTMGIVRTDADGLQHSVHAKIHMVASILALVALPIGMAMGMHHARSRWRRLAWVMVLLGAVSLVMVLVSAAGVGTLGLNSAHSWALWQAVAITVDMVLLAAFGLSSFPSQQDPGRSGSDRPQG